MYTVAHSKQNMQHAPLTETECDNAERHHQLTEHPQFYKQRQMRVHSEQLSLPFYTEAQTHTTKETN